MTELPEIVGIKKEARKRKVGIELPKLRHSEKFKNSAIDSIASKHPNSGHQHSSLKCDSSSKSILANSKFIEASTPKSQMNSRNKAITLQSSSKLSGYTYTCYDNINSSKKNLTTNIDKNVLDNSFYSSILEKYQNLNCEKPSHKQPKKKASALKNSLPSLEDLITNDKHLILKEDKLKDRTSEIAFDNKKAGVSNKNLNTINPNNDTIKMIPHNQLFTMISPKFQLKEREDFGAYNCKPLQTEICITSTKNLPNQTFWKEVNDPVRSIPLIKNITFSEMQNARSLSLHSQPIQSSNEYDDSKSSNKSLVSKKSTKKFKLFCCI